MQNLNNPLRNITRQDVKSYAINKLPDVATFITLTAATMVAYGVKKSAVPFLIDGMSYLLIGGTLCYQAVRTGAQRDDSQSSMGTAFTFFAQSAQQCWRTLCKQDREDSNSSNERALVHNNAPVHSHYVSLNNG